MGFFDIIIAIIVILLIITTAITDPKASWNYAKAIIRSGVILFNGAAKMISQVASNTTTTKGVT